MIIIADSGSTKTDWQIVDPRSGSYQEFSSIGLNPFFVTDKLVARTVSEAKPDGIGENVQAVYFYGAGCSSPKRNEVIERGLREVFPKAKCEVYHDLLGAARAGCQREAGVASILGTGSNSCLYDGHEIVDNVTNLGYVLGDEGSGGHIGKELIRARSYRDMPSDIEDAFDKMFGYEHEEMLQSVYHNPLPNRYLASFAPFCGENKDHAFFQELIERVFESFITKHLIKYDAEGLPFHFVGSIASHFESELQSVMAKHGLQLGRVIKKPIEMLRKYHSADHAI